MIRSKKDYPILYVVILTLLYDGENFAYIESFVVDIDHISEKGLNLETLKQQFQRDERIVTL